MNANELADAMQGVISVLNVHHEEDCLFIANECQFMLRQQQAEIESFKSRELTDEEIISSAEEAGFYWSEDKGIFVRHHNGNWIGRLDVKMVDFAKAILRKAQEQ